MHILNVGNSNIEDITQTVLVKAYEKVGELELLEGTKDLDSWVMTIARNKAKDFFKKGHVNKEEFFNDMGDYEEPHPDFPGRDQLIAPDNVPETALHNTVIQSHLEKLPLNNRRILEVRLENPDATHEEIANAYREKFGEEVPVGTLRSRAEVAGRKLGLTSGMRWVDEIGSQSNTPTRDR